MSSSYLIIALVMLVIVVSVIYLVNIKREFRGRDRNAKTGGDGTPLVMLSADHGSDGGGNGGGD